MIVLHPALDLVPGQQARTGCSASSAGWSSTVPLAPIWFSWTCLWSSTFRLPDFSPWPSFRQPASCPQRPCPCAGFSFAASSVVDFFEAAGAFESGLPACFDRPPQFEAGLVEAKLRQARRARQQPEPPTRYGARSDLAANFCWMTPRPPDQFLTTRLLSRFRRHQFPVRIASPSRRVRKSRHRLLP